LIKVFHDGLLQETLADSYMINANLGDIFNFLISPNWKCGSPALPGSCICYRDEPLSLWQAGAGSVV